MSLLQKGVTEDQILQRLVQLEKYPSIVNPFSEFKTDQRIKTPHDPHLHSPEDSNTINAPTSNDTSASDDDRSQVSEPKGPNSLYFAEINLPVEWPSAKIESKKSAHRQLHDSADSVMKSASEEEEEEEEGTGAHDSSYLYSVSPQRTILPIVNISANGNVGKNVAENAIDGNFDTCWSNKGIGSWLLLDLGTRKNVQSIKIAWDQGNIFDYYYEISLSDDATDFKSVRKGCSGGNSSSFLEYMLEQGSQARYIRITVKRNNYNDMAGITEIEVTGSPLRSGKTGKI